MTITIDPLLATEQNKPAYTPIITAAVSDNGLPKFDVALTTTSNNTIATLAAATMPPSPLPGPVIRVFTINGSLYYQSLTDPTNASQWAISTPDTAAGNPVTAGALIVTSPTTVIALSNSAYNHVKYRISTDKGTTWGAYSTAVTMTAVNTIAAAGTRVFFASSYYELYYTDWTGSAFTAYTTIPTANVYAHRIAATYANGSYFLYILDRTTDNRAIYTLNVYKLTGSTLTLQNTLTDLNNAIEGSYTIDSLSAYIDANNTTWLSYQLGGNTSTGGAVLNTWTMVSLSTDRTNFTAPTRLPDPDPAALTEWGNSIFSLSGKQSWRNRTITTSTVNRPITAYKLTHHGPTANLTVTFDNRDDSFSATDWLGAVLTLKRGALINNTAYTANLTGFIITGYDDDATNGAFTLYAEGAAARLLYTPITADYLTNTTLTAILSRIAILSGCTITVDIAANPTIEAYVIPAGSSLYASLTALIATYGLTLWWDNDNARFIARDNNATPDTITIPTDTNTTRLTTNHAVIIASTVGNEAISTQAHHTGIQRTYYAQHSHITTNATAAAAAESLLAAKIIPQTGTIVTRQPAFLHAEPGDTSNNIPITAIHESYRQRHHWTQTLFTGPIKFNHPANSPYAIEHPFNSATRRIFQGQVISFNLSAYTAIVTVIGREHAYELPVMHSVDPAQMTTNTFVAILMFSPDNPNDALIIGPYNGPPAYTRGSTSGDYTITGTLTIK